MPRPLSVSAGLTPTSDAPPVRAVGPDVPPVGVPADWLPLVLSTNGLLPDAPALAHAATITAIRTAPAPASNPGHHRCAAERINPCRPLFSPPTRERLLGSPVYIARLSTQ